MNRILVISILIFLLSCSNNKTANRKFNDISSRGYSQSVETNNLNTKTVYISGQVPIDINGELIGLNSLELQTEQVFKNIKKQVENAGGSMKDIVNIDCYFTDISRIEEFRKARDKFINLEAPPASTAVQIERLINEKFMIEINAIAVINKE